jgi:hypothetical protein
VLELCANQTKPTPFRAPSLPAACAPAAGCELRVEKDASKEGPEEAVNDGL